MGQEALYSYLLFCLPFNIVLYTWAINLLIPPEKLEKKSIWKKLAHPTLIAMAIGVLLGLSGVGKVLPGFVSTTLKNLSGCMGPVAMLLTGFVIGGYKIGELLRNGKVYVITFLRLLVLPCVAVAILTLLGADKEIALLAMFACGAALGLNTVVVPAAYDGDTRPGAAMAMISHIGAVITIPLLYALFTQIL
jgi:predicted permease